MIKLILLVLKLCLTAFLIYIVMSKIDYIAVGNVLKSSEGVASLLSGIVIVILQAIVGGKRMLPILELCDKRVSFFASFRMWIIGAFFSQTMISFIGGDAMRVWCLTRASLDLKTASTIILLDRALGFIALIAMFIITVPFLLSITQTSTQSIGIVLIAVASMAPILCFFFMALWHKHIYKLKLLKMLDNFAYMSYQLLTNWRTGLNVLFLSSIVHLFNVAAVYLFSRFYSVDISFLSCFAITIPTMLIAMMPISFAGWGIREASMMLGFTLLGFPAEKGLAVSVTVGIAWLLGSLPGSILFLMEKKKSFIRVEDGLYDTR